MSYAGSAGRMMESRASTSGHDPHDLETVFGREGTLDELGRSHSLSIVFHDHTAREQRSTHQELLDGARKLGRNGFAIGDHEHGQRVFWWPRK
jgi:hypothetical protein